MHASNGFHVKNFWLLCYMIFRLEEMQMKIFVSLLTSKEWIILWVLTYWRDKIKHRSPSPNEWTKMKSKTDNSKQNKQNESVSTRKTTHLTEGPCGTLILVLLIRGSDHGGTIRFRFGHQLWPLATRCWPLYLEILICSITDYCTSVTITVKVYIPGRCIVFFPFLWF